MDYPELIHAARVRSGLSQRALAELAGTSAAAICLYERGDRTPRVDTLERILHAADRELVFASRCATKIDHRNNGRDLWDVLALADCLPQRHDDLLDAPQFAALTSDCDR